MIYTFIAYAPSEHEKDLAWAYNNCMSLLPNDNDWACFIDHDAMFTTPDWYLQMENIISNNPEYSCFTTVSNRVYASWQVPDGINTINHDISYHRDIGVCMQKSNRNEVVDVTNCNNLPTSRNTSPLSGVVILYKKSAWKEVPFRLMQPKRLSGIDNLLHLDLRNKSHKVGLMIGIYVYHWHAGEFILPAKETSLMEKNLLDIASGIEWIKDTNLERKSDDGDLDAAEANKKIDKCGGGDFIIIGAPVPYTREMDVLTCLWIEHEKRKPNMLALYEPSRFASFGRNNVIHKTLKYLPGATHVFFIDKDVQPPIDAIERLLAHDKDVIVGATPIYKGQPCWSVMKYDPHETVDNIFNPIPYADLPKKLFRAHHFGGTTVLIKRHVLEEMKYPWYQDVFAPGALLLGQDLYFTAKAKQMGFELWCDPTVQCEHIRTTEMKTVFDKCCLEDKESDNGKVGN